MKPLLFLLIIIPFFANTQIITEHIIDETKSYNPLFGKEKGNIRVALEMTYTYPKDDTIMTCLIDISERKVKLEGVANSVNAGAVVSAVNNYGILGGIASIGFGSNKAYSYNNSKGVALLDYNTFDTLMKNMAIIKELSRLNNGASVGKTILFKAGKVIIGLEQKRIKDVNSNNVYLEPSFYIQIDDSTFKLSESEYDDFYGSIFKDIKKIWSEFKEYRMVGYRM